MNGAGNDFVLYDNRSRSIKLATEQVVRICDRHRGVGADGVIGLIPSQSGQADWAWEFWNSDGSVAEMCGNGARCFARYIQRMTGHPAKTSFETVAGVITAEFDHELVSVNLTAPENERLNLKVPLKSAGDTVIHSINTGVPHAVIFLPDADQAMLSTVGRPGARPQQHSGADIRARCGRGDAGLRHGCQRRGVDFRAGPRFQFAGQSPRSGRGRS